jgi:hypothetical protein
MNGTIILFGRVCCGDVAEKVETSASTASVWQDKVGGISHNAKDHVACVVTNDGIRIGSKVIQKEVTGFARDDGWFSLLVGDLVERG